MGSSVLELVEESGALNSRIFSRSRLLILSILDELPENDSATFREMKPALHLNEGVLYTNLEVLKQFGYVKEQKVKFNKKKMTAYSITRSGKEALRSLEQWLAKWLRRGTNEGKTK